ncbi:ABC transporter substrate-binding protein [Bradyrhizobium sp. LHD-71]|uniref:ABC transporter substrate-binding protein n=1 Tax=Bradyrhizobium sp. LHD-71 TaxID=3072141 RepID=UPI00280F390C|nr:ABC transporter substrate-binding protein [Bradyrhizobium sp. LHD-71]MDQ8727406.1 ABC transporter substrate-binding protein [Bradyrhizobium sp. LHD-71]
MLKARQVAPLLLSLLLVSLPVISATPAMAQKQGGTLRLYQLDNPPSASLHEESTITAVTPFSGIYNNLVMFDPFKPHESLDTIVPDLAESWTWDANRTRLTFKLHQGVTWHDGKAFTAKDVQCTWRMLIGKSDNADFRRNPRRVWWSRVEDVTTNGDFEATFELNQPQPSLLVLLASSFSPVYPCHVAQNVMRTRPVGTGPFKLAEIKRGDSIRLTRNPHYFKKGKPYLDEITFKIVESQATRLLAFQTGEFDITFPSDVHVPLFKDLQARTPSAVCKMTTTGTLTTLLVNRLNPPFDRVAIRDAVSLAIDRNAMNTILLEGKGLIGGAMLPKPAGEWGMPKSMLESLPGYGPDSAKNVADARELMKQAGFNERNPLKMKIQTRNLATYRNPAVLMIDQLKKIFIEAELEVLDSTQWYARLTRKDYTLALNGMGVAVDDPDGNIVENYACGSDRNYTQYCDANVDKLLAEQSREPDREKRKKIVWEIEQYLVKDTARPVIQFSVAGNCWHNYVKNYVPHDNSQYNYTRFEDVWLDK